MCSSLKVVKIDEIKVDVHKSPSNNLSLMENELRSGDSKMNSHNHHHKSNSRKVPDNLHLQLLFTTIHLFNNHMFNYNFDSTQRNRRSSKHYFFINRCPADIETELENM